MHNQTVVLLYEIIKLNCKILLFHINVLSYVLYLSCFNFDISF